MRKKLLHRLATKVGLENFKTVYNLAVIAYIHDGYRFDDRIAFAANLEDLECDKMDGDDIVEIFIICIQNKGVPLL